MERANLPERWWEQIAGVVRFFPKSRRLTLRDILGMLDEVQDWGFGCVEVFAPYHGGVQYDGLDVMDYYAVDPAIGTLDDFQALVEACHRRGLAIIIFVNFGYGAMDFPVFLKACDDVRAGRDSPEVHWFLWSDTGTERLDRSLAPHFMNDVDGHWCYSERAGKYYWVKWRGEQGDVELPQFNFGDPVVEREIARAAEFWMETGIDGMIIDAVNWYINCNWEINNRVMTDVIRRYPNVYIQPEGAGGFDDDPVLWITEGHYNSVQDYGLSIWWTDRYVVGTAILAGDPTPIEETLQAYRDRVVAAGGVTYIGPRWAGDRHGTGLSVPQMLLEAACVATVGELFHADQRMLRLEWPPEQMAALKRLLQVQQATPALHAAGARRRLPTQDDRKAYAFVRTSRDGRQRVLVVLNFQPSAQQIEVTLDEPVRLRELLSTGQLISSAQRQVEVRLPAYGYGIYEIA